jgi:hypothetical protein
MMVSDDYRRRKERAFVFAREQKRVDFPLKSRSLPGEKSRA